VRKYEFKVSQSVARKQEYIRKLEDLSSLEREFNELRTYLIRAIE
jgi:hypothetical protein